jgi:steroid delta-isomerase
MPDESTVRHTVEQYWKRFSAGDVDGLVALYTDDATVEDPVGTPVRHGIAEIRAFYESAQALADSIELRSLGVTEICGDQAAFAMEIRPVIGGTTYLLHAIDVMTFADDGRIASMRAFCQQEKMRPAD